MHLRDVRGGRGERGVLKFVKSSIIVGLGFSSLPSLGVFLVSITRTFLTACNYSLSTMTPVKDRNAYLRYQTIIIRHFDCESYQ